MDQAKKRKIAARVIGAPLLIATLLFLAWLDHRNGEVVAIRFLIAALSGLGMIEFLQMVRKKGYPVVWSPCIPLLVLPALPWSWILGMSVPEFFFPAALFFVASLFLYSPAPWRILCRISRLCPPWVLLSRGASDRLSCSSNVLGGDAYLVPSFPGGDKQGI